MNMGMRRGIKRTMGLTAVLLMALLPVVGCGPDPSEEGRQVSDWSQVQAQGEGRIQVIFVPAEGWAYRDSRGELTGVTVELMRWFAEWVEDEKDVVLEVAFQSQRDWGTFYQQVVEAPPGTFGIGNVTITEQRREELAFSPPYLTNVAVLISHEAQAPLSSLDDMDEAFSGLRGLAFEGTLHEERMQSVRETYMPGLDIELASSNDEIIQRVADGGYFAWVDAYNFWRAREGGAPLRHHPVGDDPGETFGVIMPKGSQWESLIEDFFESQSLPQHPRWQALLEEHLGEEVAQLLMDAANDGSDY